MRMSVIGTGYLGSTHAACMAELGHEVIGVDVDPHKIELLSRGETPFFEPGLDELVRKHIASGRLRFTTSYQEAADAAHVHFVGVGTPQQKNSYAADMTFVRSAIENLVPLLRGDHLIFGKSTVPVGTAHTLQELSRQLIDASPTTADHTSVEIAWNPEFLREGHAVQDTIRPDRIVLGVSNPDSRAEEIAREIYAQPIADGAPLLVTDFATSELVKVSANAFLATKISFINAVSEVCEASGADITVLADAIGLDDRIGRKFLNAGLGFGGGCLPKDIRAYMARAGELGADQALTFLREVDAINSRRREKLVSMVKDACGGSLGDARVTVLGAAFKPESDDVRDSPALAVAGALSLAGAHVSVYDPQAMVNAAKIFPTLTYADTARDALRNADTVVVATEWKEFRELDPNEVRECVSSPIVIDGRNCLDAAAWAQAGWTVRALGRGNLEQ
ncbi:UDP-glucose dehydrogenase family protein [Corynebacterium kroppenstedtii]|uniref:UDP-glucose dehydrogenase family protein n=1 Tax=Corynebacterium sp. PCR 32 TaxID=3351342 RepID=UPI0030AC0C69